MSAEQAPSGTDVLTLFREDLSQADRIQIFKEQAEILRSDVKNLATRKNVRYLNDNFDITFVFNSHGSPIDAGQSLEAIQSPFITFVEAAEAPDFQKSGQFIASVGNRFAMEFDGAEPQKPSWMPQAPEQTFGYWRECGLLAKGSIISPIDVRYYSARMLDALIGDKYDQDYLNQTFNSYFFQSQTADEILAEASNRGKLVMYSNAVRELTSTRQILELLIALRDHESTLAICQSPEVADKLMAITEKTRRNNDHLGIFVSYGTAHHGTVHELLQRGIDAKRVFPGSVDVPAPLSFAGNSMDRFFNAHHFDVSEEDLEQYAKAYVLESMLWIPVRESDTYGVFAPDYQAYRDLFQQIPKIARSPELLGQFETIIEAFKADPLTPVNILGQAGVILRPVTA